MQEASCQKARVACKALSRSLVLTGMSFCVPDKGQQSDIYAMCGMEEEWIAFEEKGPYGRRGEFHVGWVSATIIEWEEIHGRSTLDDRRDSVIGRDMPPAIPKKKAER